MCVLDWGGHWADHLSLVEFAYNNSFQASIGMAPFEALYGRPCRTPLCWTQVGERSMYGATYVQETTEKVRVVRLNMKEAQDRQKSYADRRRRELEFQVGDRVYLKMAMLRGPNRSIAENKLSPRFMGPFPVVERVGPLAYRLELPEIMKAFHKVFHVSMLRKCLHPTEELVARIPEDLQPDLTVPAVPVRILERREKVLRNKRIPLLRILWDCSGSTEETWEPEAKMKLKFRKWFDKQVEEIAILNNSSCFWRLRSLGASRPQLSVAYLGASRPQYKQFSSSGCKWASVWTFRVRLGASGPQCGPVWTCLGASGPQYKWFVCLDDELGVKIFLERAYDIGFDVCLGDQVRISSVAALRGRVFVVFVTFGWDSRTNPV
ncbi:unnamed protein product [Microthlaspi erraticum]|uniref:Tf2-1-like SH3-like domain-containing protein n=1 Tax=Microthlaspi erraticum TaxID=1685480 RepID=A0A6D2JBZ8_9BRAS|nr:unnamed protein product [Microthlaspi erraticum]